MKYNEQTREITITLPEGDFYNKSELIKALLAIEDMTEEKGSQYFVFTRISTMQGYRASRLLPDLSLYLSYILKREVEDMFDESIKKAKAQ